MEWDEEPDPQTPAQEGQRLTLHKEGSGSFLRIHQSYSHPTEEVTPLGHHSCPYVPSSTGCAAGTALLLLAAAPAVSSVPGTALRPLLPLLPHPSPTRHPQNRPASPKGWTRVGAASHGFIGEGECSPRHGVAKIGRCWGGAPWEQGTGLV